MENIVTNGCAGKIPEMEYITIRLKEVRNILGSIFILIGGEVMLKPAQLYKEELRKLFEDMVRP